MAQSGRVRILVTDRTGAVVPTAEASLLGSDNSTIRTEAANGTGEIVFVDLPFGDSRFAVKALGFNTRRLMATIRNGDELKVEAVLEVGSIGTTIEVAAEKSPPSQVAVSAPAPEPKHPKRRRWLVFR
jgi:uncharacterized surface anchored protein